MPQIGYQTPNPQKPITPDEVGDGKLCLQIMFKSGEDFYAFNAMGPTEEFLRDGQMRATAIVTLLAAAMSLAGAVHGIDLSQEVVRPLPSLKIHRT